MSWQFVGKGRRGGGGGGGGGQLADDWIIYIELIILNEDIEM